MKINLDKIKAKIAQLNGEGKSQDNSKVQLWKPGVGDYVIRCLHWPSGVCREGEVFQELWFYYNISQKGGLLAPDQYGKPDPIKELRMKLFQSGNPSDKELAKKLFPKMRSYIPVVVLSGPDANPEKVQVWTFGSQIYQKLLGYFMNEKIGDYFDPKSGFNLNVKVSKQKNKTFFDTEVELDALGGRCPVAETDEKIKELLDKIPDINGMFTLKDYDTIQKELNAYLNGNADVDTKSDSSGVEKGNDNDSKNSLDDLDELVEDVKKDKVEKKKSSPPPAKEKKPAKAKENDEKASDDLDAAFEDLMSDD